MLLFSEKIRLASFYYVSHARFFNSATNGIKIEKIEHKNYLITYILRNTHQKAMS